MLFQIKSYLQFLWHSKNEHGVHSPFVFSLVTKCFYDKKNKPEYTLIKDYRKALLENKNTIDVTDFGAGSRVFKSNTRAINQIAKNAGISSKRVALLFRIVHYFQPKNILEIGTYTGYSALCLCEGMQESGELHTIDIKEELVNFQRKHFDKSPWGKQIVQHLGNAIEIIPTLNLKFDLVFIDADKENYLNYFELIVPKMNKGGIILSDNVLWSGKVLEPLQKNDLSTKVLLEYNQLLKNDPRVETVLLPIRDGLTVSRVL